MKILWYSSTPECSSGYGNTTRNMVKWLQRQGHWVAVATKHALTNAFEMWDFGESETIIKYAKFALEAGDLQGAMDALQSRKTIPIVLGTNIDRVNEDVMDKWSMDVCISMYDVWGLKKPLHRHIAWIPIDTEVVNEKIIRVTKDLPMQIAMSYHGKAELESRGLKPEYAPIGFDPEVFHPRPERGEEFRASLVFPDHPLDPEDMFLIGSVGINYPDDRKGYIRLMQAFKIFHDRHPNARLYLHTVAHKTEDGHNYAGHAVELGIDKLIVFPDQSMMFFDSYGEDLLSETYSGFDVFCLPTKGEGFGMPVVEAQACGVPVLVSNNTSMPQLCKTGWLIDRNWDDREHLSSKVWRYPPRAEAILEGLEKAYTTKKRSEAEKQRISEGVSEYQWNNVWEKYWTPIMAKIEALVSSGELRKGEENGIQNKTE